MKKLSTLLFIFFLQFCNFVVAQTPYLIKDLNISVAGASSNPTNFIDINGVVYFTADDGIHGIELWKTDGTAVGTKMVKDINEGNSGSSPNNLVNFNGTLFFSADNGINGQELWKSDGSSLGTVLVKDINTGANSSSPRGFINANGTLFFVAHHEDTGFELWKSDGTFIGTSLVKDIRNGSDSSFGFPLSIHNLNGTIIFFADDGIHGTELWKSDGTEQGTTILKDIAEGNSSSILGSLVHIYGPINGIVFFRADDGNTGTELWKTDGTTNGTVMVKDISTGSLGSLPRQFIAINNTFYFVARDQNNGTNIWISDGTEQGTSLVSSYISGTSVFFPQKYYTNVNGVLYIGFSSDNNYAEVWKYDTFSSDAAKLVKTIYVGSSPEAPKELINANGTLYFVANDGVSGTELWLSDGTNTGTKIAADINIGAAGSSPNNLFYSNGILYFSANDGSKGTELWAINFSPTVLPLKWLDFNAKLTLDKKVALDWKVKEEKIEKFEIEHSIDGKNFKTLNNQPSKGDGINSYTYTHLIPFSANNYTTYYRIKQKDINGGIDYSEIKSINDALSNELLIYPNPIKDKFNIISNTSQVVKITDITGKTVQISTLKTGPNELSTTQWLPGLYILTIGENTYKIIKN